MKIYVIRHGTTELNKQKLLNGQIDEELSQEGIDEVRAALSSIPKTIVKIFSSPMARARQTTEIVNEKLEKPVNFQDEIREIHMGSLAGKSWDSIDRGQELKKIHRSVLFDYREDGGESADEVKQRVLLFLKKLEGNYDDYQVLVVTHGGIIRVLHLLESGEQLLDEVKHITPLVFDVRKILERASP